MNNKPVLYAEAFEHVITVRQFIFVS